MALPELFIGRFGRELNGRLAPVAPLAGAKRPVSAPSDAGNLALERAP